MWDDWQSPDTLHLVAADKVILHPRGNVGSELRQCFIYLQGREALQQALLFQGKKWAQAVLLQAWWDDSIHDYSPASNDAAGTVVPLLRQRKKKKSFLCITCPPNPTL